MGVYLSMLGNQKPEPAHNIRPDENYAREFMQLFTDRPRASSIAMAASQRDAPGQPIPTFDQADHRGLRARVHRLEMGLRRSSPANCAFARADARESGAARCRPSRSSMRRARSKCWRTRALRAPSLPAGQTATQDLADALDNMVNHPNVGPFIARQLIQKLVTSNPSPAYVQRVGARLQQRRHGPARQSCRRRHARFCSMPKRARHRRGATAGKVKEPLLRLTQFWRAYDANGRERQDDVGVGPHQRAFGQGPLHVALGVQFLQPLLCAAGGDRGRRIWSPPSCSLPPSIRTRRSATISTRQAFARATPQSHVSGSRRHRHYRHRAEICPARLRPQRWSTASRTGCWRGQMSSDAERRRPSGRSQRVAACERPARESAEAVVARHDFARVSRCSAERRSGAEVNSTDFSIAAASSKRGRCRRRRLRLRPDAGYRLTHRWPARRLRRLQGARLRVPVRRQRLVEHGGAVAAHAEYAAYKASRQKLAVDRGVAAAAQSPLADPTAATFGLHPAHGGLADLFKAGRSGSRRQRRSAARAHDESSSTSTLGCASAAALLAQRPAGPVAFAQGQRAPRNRVGPAAWPTCWRPRRAKPAARAECVARRARRCFRPARAAVPYTMGAAGPDDLSRRSRTAAVGSSRRQAFTSVAEASYDTVYEQAFADVHLQRACSFGDSVNAALAATPDFASLPDVPTLELSRLSRAVAHGGEADRRPRPAADVAADLLRRDRRLRHARRPGRRTSQLCLGR